MNFKNAVYGHTDGAEELKTDWKDIQRTPALGEKGHPETREGTTASHTHRGTKTMRKAGYQALTHGYLATGR